MKTCLVFAVLLALTANADPRYGSAVEYHFDGSYVLVAATDLRVVIELRASDGDQVIDNVTVPSRYMPPEFEGEDLVSDDTPEFILHTRGGGTGFAETHCAIYGIVSKKIRRLGDFVVERSAQSWSEPEQHEKLTGKVSFPRKGELLYSYTQVVSKSGKTATNSVVDRFWFNPKQMEYEKVKRP